VRRDDRRGGGARAAAPSARDRHPGPGPRHRRARAPHRGGTRPLAAGLHRVVARGRGGLQPHVLRRVRTRDVERTRPPPHPRAPVISAAYVVGYLVQAVAALGLGVLATTTGLQFALELGAPVILLLGVAALVVANTARRRAPV